MGAARERSGEYHATVGGCRCRGADARARRRTGAPGHGPDHLGFAQRSGADRAGRRAFDVIPSSHKDSITAGELRGEYRFGDVLWVIDPFVGASVTTRGATYEYFGFGFDIDFGPNWVLTPNGAAGVFARGSGTDLGSWWEFRTGAELDYRFANQDRLGVAFQHMSNCRPDQQNPGEESVTLHLHLAGALVIRRRAAESLRSTRLTAELTGARTHAR